MQKALLRIWILVAIIINLYHIEVCANSYPKEITYIINENKIDCDLEITAVSIYGTICNAEITITATGGTGILEYSLDGSPFQTSNVFISNNPGLQLVEVMDENGCTANFAVVLVIFSAVIIDDIDISDTNCGENSGTLTINASGGSGSLEYSIDGINFQSSNTFEDLSEGTYTVTVQDIVNGCIISEEVDIITSGASPQIDNITTTNTSCGQNNGNLEITATLGTPPLEYSIDNINFQTSNTFNDLNHGSYTIVVQDINGCSVSENIEILDSDGIQIADINITNATCGNINGAIQINANSVSTPLQYSFDGINFQSNNTFIDLEANTYNITVQDANGCTDTQSAIITNSQSPSIASIDITNASCGNNNGSLQINTINGLAPLTYSIDNINFQPNNIFSGLTQGVYLITVQDEDGCIDTESITILSTSSPQVDDISIVNTSCGLDNGILTITASQGSAPLAYSLDGINFQNENTFPNLASNNYTIYVQDASGCIITESAIILDSESVEITDINIENNNCENNNGTIEIIASGSNSSLEYSIDGINFQFNNFFINLEANTYNITVQDANGCTNLESVIINSDDNFEITSVNTNDSNCGNNNGSLQVITTGGVTPIEYSIDGTNFQQSDTFNNLSPNNYTITSIDNNGCVEYFDVEIATSEGPQLGNVEITNPSCGNSNGAMEIIADNGTPPLEYSIDGISFQNSNDFTDLNTGIYTVVVQDANGCSTETNININSSDGPNIIDIQITNAYCGNENASISVFANGGTGFIEYSIDGINYQSSNLFQNLYADNYTIFIQDANGCRDIINIEIENIDGPEIESTDITNSNCENNDGSITINTTNGTAPLEFSLDGDQFQSSNAFYNLSPGLYLIYIKDANGCLINKEINVNSNSGPIIENTQIVDAICGNSNGSIEIFATNGIPLLQYSLDGVDFQVDKYFENLSAGEYTIYVKDNLGCIVTQTITIQDVDELQIDNIESSDPTCGDSNGTIEIIVSLGKAPFKYSIDGVNFEDNNEFQDLTSGIYDIIVRDANGCSKEQQVSLSSNDGPSIESIETTPSICDAMNGAIAIFASGDTPPFQYSIDGANFQASNIFDNLSQGIYNITVQDANTCKSQSIVTISSSSSPIIESIETNNSGCTNMDGTININVSSGAAPIEYSIDGTNFQSSNSFNNLSAGIYSIIVRDENGCTSLSTVEIESSNGPIIDIINTTDTSCGASNGSLEIVLSEGESPITYSIDGINFQDENFFNNLSEGIYYVIVSDGGSCISNQEVFIQSTSGPIINEINITNSQCFENNGAITVLVDGGQTPIQYSIDGTNFQVNNNFENLTAGTYTVTIIDSNECTFLQNIEILNSDTPLIEEVVITSASCNINNGRITINTNQANENIQYSINGVDFQTSNTFTDLESKIYEITIRNEAGCEDKDIANVPYIDPPSIENIELFNANCGKQDGNISITANSTVGNLEYSINEEAFQFENKFYNLPKGFYLISIIDDSDCEIQESVEIKSENCGIYIPNIFSPNNDGNNDLFQISSSDDFNGELLDAKIYDRWGSIFYKAQNIDIQSLAWDGTMEGQNAMTGVYLYILKIENENGQIETLTGDITLVR